MVKFGTGARFPPRIKVNQRPTPGPQYEIPSTIKTGLKSDGSNINKKNVAPYKELRHYFNGEIALEVKKGNKDRLSWMKISGEAPGPKYSPKHETLKPRAPSHSVGKGARFRAKSTPFISEEHLTTKLGEYGPGPKYVPADQNYTKKKAPGYSFGARRPLEHAHSEFFKSYLKSTFKRVGPAEYDTSHVKAIGNPTGGAPRARIGKNPRFQKTEFLSEKLNKRSILGMSSPGPAYNPGNNTILEKQNRTRHSQKIAPESVRQRDPKAMKKKAKKKEGRHSWLRGNNIKQPVSGGSVLVRAVLAEDCSPGPGCYNIPGGFGKSTAYFEPLKQKMKRKSNRKLKPHTARVPSTLHRSVTAPSTTGAKSARSSSTRAQKKKSRLIENLLRDEPEGDGKTSDYSRSQLAIEKAGVIARRQKKTPVMHTPAAPES